MVIATARNLYELRIVRSDGLLCVQCPYTNGTLEPSGFAPIILSDDRAQRQALSLAHHSCGDWISEYIVYPALILNKTE